jgi:hypothetical protein
MFNERAAVSEDIFASLEPGSGLFLVFSENNARVLETINGVQERKI